MTYLSLVQARDKAGRPEPLGSGLERLWSLWDMLELNAAAFYEATADLRYIQAVIKEHQHDQDSLFDSGNVLSSVEKEWFSQPLENLKIQLSVLGVRVTAVLANRMMDDPRDNTGLTWGKLTQRCEHLMSRLYDELTLKKVLVLEDKDLEYYHPLQPIFGFDFAEKFVSASYDLDEAAQCIAFARSTAAVFHLMRVMEVGIKALAACLGAPDPTRPSDRNWAFLMRGIKDGIDAKWPTQNLRLSGDAPVFEGLYASLDAVKNPWRNATMHVENKYTEDEAQHIFYAVRGFMKKLASRMDERGEPKA